MDAKTWNALTERERTERLEHIGAGICPIPSHFADRAWDDLPAATRKALDARDPSPVTKKLATRKAALKRRRK